MSLGWGWRAEQQHNRKGFGTSAQKGREGGYLPHLLLVLG